jgi:integrase
MRKAWAEICAEAVVADLRIHDLRHWHASLLAGEGFGLLDIGKALGHRSSSTSGRYTHVVEKRQREAATRLGEVVSLAGRRAK